MTTTDIPPIVLLVESDRETLEKYSRHLESGGMWGAGTTACDELIASAEELHPDVIIVDADSAQNEGVPQALDALRRHRDLAGTPLVVLATSSAQATTDSAITLERPVPPEFLLRRTREVLGRARELRGRSNAIATHARKLLDRSDSLLGKGAAIAAAIDDTRGACPKCSAQLEWVERGTIAGVSYDYYRWCPHGCGLYCLNRDKRTWIRLA